MYEYNDSNDTTLHCFRHLYEKNEEQINVQLQNGMDSTK